VARQIVRIVFILFLLPAMSAWGAERITGFRISETPALSRIVFDLTNSSFYHVFELSDPHRVVIDIKNSAWAVRSKVSFQADGIVSQMRHGIKEGTDLRVVLDLQRPATVKHSFIIPPQNGMGYRLVVDLLPATGSKVSTAGIAKAPPAVSAAVQQVPPKQMSPTPRKPTIILDPGHGGEDPGAIGVGLGVFEKHITLTYALALKKQLEATGAYKVMLTRESDFYVPLGARVEKARKLGGDLFISLHADSHPQPEMCGLSVYTLSEQASDKEAEALALRESKEDIITGVNLANASQEVTNVLIDLMQRETKNISADCAEEIVFSLSRQVRVVKNTHRFAGFKVLKGIDMPAVLIELGYLSNREEEKALSSQAYRKKIVDSVSKAIDNHFSKRKL
jgi:N-acetylmuramoyl-L-alanine amidase